MARIGQLIKQARIKKKKSKRNKALKGNPQKKGVIIKVTTVKPKKPNSARRKIAKVKLTNRKKIICYIPGEGHTLQVHNTVLIRGGRTKDLPGVQYKIIRGKFDCTGVENRKTSRSKYGTPSSFH